MNRLTSSPLGSYSYGDTAHADAATAVGAAWSASYDAAGNATCRAATSAQTCAGTSPTGATLSYDNAGQLAAWQNTPTAPTSSAQYLYDGEGNRVQQVATINGVTTTTSYVGSLEEVTTSGSTTTTTAYYGGLALSVNGALCYTLSDGLGSVTESVNTSSGASPRRSSTAPTAVCATAVARCPQTRASPGNATTRPPAGWTTTMRATTTR